MTGTWTLSVLEVAMVINRCFALCTAGALAFAVTLAPGTESFARDRSAPITDVSAQQKKKPGAVQRRAAPRAVAPRRVAPKTVAPRRVAPKTVTPRRVVPRTVTPRTVTPRVTATPRTPRAVTPTGARAGTVTAARFRGIPRGAGRAAIRGQRFSTWRGGGYRVRYGGGWRTFVALTALGAIAIGAATYYPYAYIAAPRDYCDGLTEDGCQLMWQEVETLEGGVADQCVAYCPWQ
jgi:hypothetical protein